MASGGQGGGLALDREDAASDLELPQTGPALLR